MTPEELETFRQLLLQLREDLLSTSEVRDETSGTVCNHPLKSVHA